MTRIELIGAAMAGLAAVAGWIWAQLRKERKRGAEQQRASDAKETIKRVERGQQAVTRGRASGDSPADRLRRNDGKW